MGTDTRPGLSQCICTDERVGMESMENTSLTPIDGTAALSPSASLEMELARDRWDARNIPGLRYAPHRNAHYIIFSDVPGTFRPVVKEYVRFSARSRSSCENTR